MCLSLYQYLNWQINDNSYTRVSLTLNSQINIQVRHPMNCCLRLDVSMFFAHFFRITIPIDNVRPKIILLSYGNNLLPGYLNINQEFLTDRLTLFWFTHYVRYVDALSDWRNPVFCFASALNKASLARKFSRSICNFTS